MIAITIVFHFSNQHLPDVCHICFYLSILKTISLSSLCIHPLAHSPAMTHSFTCSFIPQTFSEKLLYARNWFSPWDYKRVSNRPDLCPHSVNDLARGSANRGLWAKSDPSPGFIDKVLLGYSHVHALVDCLWLLSMVGRVVGTESVWTQSKPYTSKVC